MSEATPFDFAQEVVCIAKDKENDNEAEGSERKGGSKGQGGGRSRSLEGSEGSSKKGDADDQLLPQGDIYRFGPVGKRMVATPDIESLFVQTRRERGTL